MPRGRLDALTATLRWRAANPSAYAKMLEWARNDRDAHRHGSVRFYTELLRRPEFSGIITETPYLVDNRMLGVLSRMLLQDDPRLDGTIKLRYSFDLDEPGAPNEKPRPRWIEVDAA